MGKELDVLKIAYLRKEINNSIRRQRVTEEHSIVGSGYSKVIDNYIQKRLAVRDSIKRPNGIQATEDQEKA